MESEILEAARLGKIEELHGILERDPVALERMQLLATPENPLHVAALTEQVEFAKEIIERRPQFAMETNKEGLIPLHVACATGNVAMVRLFMEMERQMCLTKDKSGWTGLHFAALRGRVAVVKELLQRCPDAADEITFQGDTALHLAVKNSRVDVVQAFLQGVGDRRAKHLLLVPDGDGRTVEQLALATKQFQVARLLNIGIEESMEDEVVGAVSATRCVDTIGATQLPDEEAKSTVSRITAASEVETRPEEAILRTLMTGLDRMAPVVASVIASTTYSAALSPPKSLFKENMKIDLHCFKNMHFRSSTTFQDLTQPTTSCPSFIFLSFISFNTAGFLTAVLIILLHPNVRLAPLLLTSALMFLTITYVSLTVSMSPNFLTFLLIYGTSIVVFFCVLFYVTASKSVLRWFIRLWLVITNRSHQHHHHSRTKGILCC